MLARMPRQPSSYSATIKRSDGKLSKVAIHGDQRRIELFVSGGSPNSIVVSDPTKRQLFSYDPGTRKCFVSRLPFGMLLLRDFIDRVSRFFGTKYFPEKAEMVNGFTCTCFGLPRNGQIIERCWVDEDSGLTIRKQTYDLTGKPVLTINFIDIVIGPPPQEIFEQLHGYEFVKNY
jgi:hypothetical protein